MTKKIRIVSKKEGFRRAGMAHSENPTLHDPEAFTEKQLAQLKAEPMLIVDEIDVKDAPSKPDADDAGKDKAPPKGAGKK